MTCPRPPPPYSTCPRPPPPYSSQAYCSPTNVPPTLRLERLGIFKSDMVLHADGQPAYYLEIHSWTTGPQLILHASGDAAGAVVAAYRNHVFGANELWLGDPREGAVPSAEVESPGFGYSEHTFVIPGVHETGVRRLVWETSHDKQYGLSRFSSPGFILKEAEGSGKVLCVFRLLSYNGRERGEFAWEADVGVTRAEELGSVMVMLGVFQQLRNSSK